MSDQSGAVAINPVAKKAIVFGILIIAVVLFSLLFSKGVTKRPKIIGEGDRAPLFTLTSLDGRQVSLSNFRGKIVMVHFWATWCPPCVEEIPTIDKLSRRMAGKDFEILAVNVDQGGAPDVSSFMKRNSLTLPVLLDPEQSIAALYGTFKLPETYILDRNGIVKHKVIGPRDWSDPVSIKALEDLIAAP